MSSGGLGRRGARRSRRPVPRAGLLFSCCDPGIFSSAAGDVCPAAGRPGHLLVGACSQALTSRGKRPARACVPAAHSLLGVPSRVRLAASLFSRWGWENSEEASSDPGKRKPAKEGRRASGGTVCGGGGASRGLEEVEALLGAGREGSPQSGIRLPAVDPGPQAPLLTALPTDFGCCVDDAAQQQSAELTISALSLALCRSRN